nr:mitochondrial ribosome-associated GTPase 1 isoform X3 [Manis javanica]
MRLPARSLCGAAGAAWRERFPLGGRDVARWFPGHMAKGLKKMQSSLKLVDCIIEVHDARISFGRNPLFRETLGLKPHLLVLNKMDLADLKEQQKILQHLEGEGLQNVIFTNCVKDVNIKQVIPMVTELVGSSYRYHRGENLEACVLVVGVPNVGKSSLINSLRRQHLKKGKATRVGGEPGITRAVMSRIQVCERPLTFLLDTPGVLAPRIESVETGLKLALCAACFQEPCWITWWGRRRWQTTFSTPSTGISSLAVEPHEGGPSNQLTGLADSCIWSSFSQSRPSRWACFPAEMPDHSCWDAGHFELYFLGPVKIPEPCSGTVIWKQFGAVRPGGLEQLPWPRQGPACPNTVGPEASVCTCLWVRPQPLCLSAWGVSFLL